jgi:hypothetical protein
MWPSLAVVWCSWSGATRRRGSTPRSYVGSPSPERESRLRGTQRDKLSAVWVRRSAIKPIPRHARVPQSVVAAACGKLATLDARAERLVREGHERFSVEQPAVARYLIERLPPSLDGVALALGRMLSVAVFLAFEALPTGVLRAVSADTVASADVSLGADEELRRADPMDALETEDIVAIEQPALVAFVNQHVGLTLQKHAETVDVDHVAVVFRAILVEILALSHAVSPLEGFSIGPDERLA